MQAILLKQPYSLSFSKNPIPFTFALSPYGDTERRQSIRLLVKISVEKVFGSGAFDEVRSQVFFPDSRGIIAMDVSTLVDPYLAYYTPRPSLAVPVQAVGQSLRFKLAWLLEKDDVPVGALQESAAFNCIKGGMALEEWHPSEFFTINTATNKQMLSWFPFDKIGAGDLRYLYWLFLSPEGGVQTVTVRMRGSNGQTYSYAFPGLLAGIQNAVYCAPVSVSLLNTALLPAGVELTDVALFVQSPNAVIADSGWMAVEQRQAYNTHCLLFRNSLGGLDTVSLRGQVDYEADYARLSASRTLPPSAYKNANLLSAQTSASTETEKWKGDTGFISKATIERLRDLLLSDDVYAYKNGRLIPVVISSKSAKFYTNRDNLISLAIEWSHAHTNENFTPAGAMPQSRTCPALEKFDVLQLNKKTLQILFALPAPYDLCEVKLTIGTTVETIQLQGNAGVVNYSFTNPLATGTMGISIEARCVCNPDSSPADKGPVSTKTLTIYGNAPVVANADTFTIAAGFNTAVSLPGSVLDNDYDPDGDPIAVTAASGATQKGGSFSINAAGNVQYTPPSSAFVGTDTFTYQVQEASGLSTGTGIVTVNVGTVATTVYAKCAKRNASTGGNGNSSMEVGEIWLQFSSDPAGSVAYDVTALNLTVNYEKKTVGTGIYNSSGNNNTQNGSVTATGTEMKLYEGMLQTHLQQLGLTGDLTVTFKTLAGTGYTAI